MRASYLQRLEKREGACYNGDNNMKRSAIMEENIGTDIVALNRDVEPALLADRAPHRR